MEKRVTRVYDPGGGVCEEEIRVTEQQDKYSQQHEENNNNDNQLNEDEPSIENINLKKMEEWSEEELNMIEDINDNTAGVANFVVNLLKHELNDISNDVKMHKRMYKNGYTKQKGNAGIIIHDILFDTGASHASYVSKDLVDLYRDMWKDNIKKTKAKVILGDNKTTLNIEETLTLNLGFKYGDKTRDETAEVTMCVIDMPGKSIIIGLPDIIAYFYYVFIDMINEARIVWIQNRK